MSRGKSLSHQRASAIGLAVFATLGGRSALAQTQNSTWNGSASTSWNTAGNWSPSGIPNNNTNGFTDYNVTIGAPSPTLLNSTVTIDSMTLGTAGLLNIVGGINLTLNGPTLSNAGTITVNSGATFAGTTLILNNVSLSGGGTIDLNDDATTTTAAINGTFTQVSGNTIDGEGFINAPLTNDGAVNANQTGHGITIETSTETNNNLLEASSGGTLAITSVTINQGTSGQITSNTGSFVNLSGATINGGTLNGTGLFQLVSGNAFTNLTNNATVNELGNQSLTVNGNLSNTGTITVNSNQNFAVTGISFTGGMLSGGGTIDLNDDATTTTAAISGTLTQVGGNTIDGEGFINASLINDGTVNANQSGHGITLETSAETNNSLLEASSGGTLAITNVTINQGTSGQITSNTGSFVNLSGATISGGTLNGTGLFQVLSGNNAFTNLTNNATVNELDDQTLTVNGNLSNTGTITINSNQIFAVTGISFTGGMLSGGGTIDLNDDATDTTATINGTLTQVPGNTVDGEGAINALFTNDGVVNANVTGHLITLQTNSETNNNLLESTSGGTLAVTNITVNQGTSGQITANTGSFVNFNGATISGGALSGSGLFQVLSGNNTFANLTSYSTVNELSDLSLTVNGNLSNTGTITINSNQGFSVTGVFFTGGNLSGGGTIDLNDDGSNTTATINGTLTQVSGNTIDGQGAINALFTNDGVVNADQAGHQIFLESNNETNNNLLEATNGGTLSVSGINIAQGTAGQIAATGTGSLVTISGSNITAGLITVGGGSTLRFTGASTVSGSITNNGTVSVQAGNSSTPVVVGPITGSGALNLGTNDYLRLSPSPVATTVSSINSSSGSILDITTNGVDINYGSAANDPVSTIASALGRGYNNGAWNGTGILSTTAAAGSPGISLSVGYADGDIANDLQKVSGLQPNQILIQYTLAGDANLDGVVNFADLLVVAQNFNKTGEDWVGGNFIYLSTGLVNFSDLLIVAQNFNKALNPAATSSVSLGGNIDSLAVKVPEPGALAMTIGLGAGLLARPPAAG